MQLLYTLLSIFWCINITLALIVWYVIKCGIISDKSVHFLFISFHSSSKCNRFDCTFPDTLEFYVECANNKFLCVKISCFFFFFFNSLRFVQIYEMVVKISMNRYWTDCVQQWISLWFSFQRIPTSYAFTHTYTYFVYDDNGNLTVACMTQMFSKLIIVTVVYIGCSL